MRLLLIALGIATVVLAVILAGEHLWWIAVPEALFGIAVAFAAAESLREDRRALLAGAATPASPGVVTTPAATAPTLEFPKRPATTQPTRKAGSNSRAAR